MEPRAPQPQELERIVSFLNSQLRPQVNWSITEEYPGAFSDHNLKNIRIITEQEKIISHAVVKYLVIKTPLGFFKVAAIGSVVTDTAYRHQGLGRKILESCIEAAQQEKCDFAILWTDLYDFYRKLDFELTGHELAIVIEKPLNVDSDELRFMETSKVSADAICKLYSQHTVGTVRNSIDISRSLNIPNSRVFTAWDHNNQLQAYAVEGRGADLTGYVHEWGGGVSKLLPLLNYVREVTGKPITLIAPHHSQNLVRQLEKQPVLINKGFLGMIRPLDTAGLFFKVTRYARMHGLEGLKLEERDGLYYIGYKDHLFRTDSIRDITRLIFGPGRAEDIYPFEPSMCEALNKLLPIPMWIWGWDSV